MLLSIEERAKACRIGEQVACQHGYQVRGTGALVCDPVEVAGEVLVIAVPVAMQEMAHIVLQVLHKATGRVLHTLNVHVVSDQFVASECAHCDMYCRVEEIDEEVDPVELEKGHVCEGGDDWHDGDKGGYEPCTRTDTQWYEFWMTGSAGFYCPQHWPYESDMALLRRLRERAVNLGIP